MNSSKKEIELPWTKEYITKVFGISNDLTRSLIIRSYDGWFECLQVHGNNLPDKENIKNYQQELFKYKVELLLKE